MRVNELKEYIKDFEYQRDYNSTYIEIYPKGTVWWDFETNGGNVKIIKKITIEKDAPSTSAN